MAPEAPGRHSLTNNRAARRERLQLVRELVGRFEVANQHDLARLLTERGFEVTQATVSRDIAELGLVKVARGGRHVYATPEALVGASSDGDERLRRVLSDLPVTVRRSGLILLLVASPGSAPAIAEAIDRSTLDEQEGTLAGDNTVLVLFVDEDRLAAWEQKLARLQSGGS